MALIYPTSQNFVQKTLASQLLSGVTASASLNNVTGIQNKVGVMIIDRVDSNNVETPNKREVVKFTGTSGTTVVTLTRNADGSGTDQDHAVGAIVEFGPDILWAQSVCDEFAGKAPLDSPTFTGTVTLPTGLTGIAKMASGVVSAVTAPSGDIVGTTDTQTLTNKRTDPRIVSATSYTTDTGTSLSVATCDLFVITAQAGALKFNNPGGTPVQGDKLIIRIKDDGTARALTYDTQFRAMGTALPTTTTLGKTMYIGLIYSSTDTKWDCVAVATEA